MSKTLFVVGAFDRYNYGDLLFPVVVEAAVKAQLKDVEIVFCSPFGHDYCDIGSVKSISYKEMLKKVKDHDDIMIAGGGVLSAQWFETLVYLYTPFKANLFKVLRRLLPTQIFNVLLNVPTRFPYVFDSYDFGHQVNFFYNAVGGSSIEQLSLTQKTSLFKLLEKADYIAVRDNATYGHFMDQSIDNRVNKVPDSVSILSDLLPLEALLTTHCTQEVFQWIQRHKKNYFCIQIGKNYLDKSAGTIAQELLKVYQEEKMPIVLLPIGTATGHEDDVALKAIEVALDSSIEYFYLDNINIHNTIALIAAAGVFAGTSLHGAITSMSYNVPHFAFSKNVKKLANYIETWDVEAIHYNVSYNTIAQHVNEAKRVEQNVLTENSDKLKNAVYEHFKTMTHLMQGGINE